MEAALLVAEAWCSFLRMTPLKVPIAMVLDMQQELIVLKHEIYGCRHN